MNQTRGRIKFCIVLGLLTMMLLSSVASADPSLQTLRCDTVYTVIGNTADSATDFICSVSAVPLSIGLLGDSTNSSTATAVRIGIVGNGPWDYIHFINNSYPTGGIVTAYSANISTRVGTAGRYNYVWYELGYYDPNGVPGNFVGMFISTAANATTTTVKSFNVAFNSQSGIIPFGKKLAVRVWTNSTNGTDRPYFYSYNGSTTANSSIVIDFIPNTMYSLSGYLTDTSSGLPLNGAIIQTNTSQTTTTDSQGYFNFPSLADGSYNISATLYGYDSGYTIQTVNGANTINANFSLMQQTTYLLSGYVKDQTSGAPISGATVKTDVGLTTSTDPAGYYNFNVVNGTILITARNTGYYEKSITKTVNGASVGNSNISLVQETTTGKIHVATNRFVILDDWSTLGNNGSGFSMASYTHVVNEWKGKNTRINATALFIDDSGTPQIGSNVTFNLYDPSGAEYTTAKMNAITDANGLAGFSFDLDAVNYYGNWTVKASTGDFSSFDDSTGFIYNWWGCGTNAGCRGTSGTSHATRSVGKIYLPANSPYLSGRENVSWNDHGSAPLNASCTNCHQSFDSMPGGNTINGTNHQNHTADVHRDITCDNPGCHQTNAVHGGSTGAVIGSCYSATCHTPANRSDISGKSTLSSSDVATALSLYSIDSTSFNATFHTRDSTVPCTICHGPMHNISKPDVTQRFIRNSFTETSHCTTCHTKQVGVHDNGVYCTFCHSNDAHAIKGAAGDCLGCHPTVTSADLGLHSNFNGNPAVENSDCKTCHFGSFPMVKGAVNKSNTYFCADCHTTAGTGPNKSTTRIFTEKKHGKAACIDCHVADGIYHQGNPRGSVANLTYVNRYSSGNTITTDCADCHYAKNLDDAPFNAPGGGSHINSVGGSCTTGGGGSCHAGGATLIQTIHSLSGKSQGNKPAVTTPTLSLATVTKGSDVTVDTRVTIASLYELVDGAQYRIMLGGTEVKSWTPMSAIGGNFGGSNTNATAIIKTDSLNPGTYSIEVRGMAGGLAQNTSIRYYPMNGDVSTTKSTPLTVISQNGYINGTITNSSGSGLPGAIIGTNPASITATTASDGTYSLSLVPGTYDVTASKQPTHTDNTTYGVIVTASNTTYANMTLDIKLTGTITGSVTTG